MPNRILKECDREVIGVLRELNILEEIDPAQIPAEDGVIKIQCPDGMQLLDRLDHERKLIESRGKVFRPHMPSLHGGAMLIAEDCPAYREFRVDELLLLHIREAERMTYIHTVVLNIHAPCGKACELGLTLIQQMLFLMRAKVRVKAIDPTNKVICFVHIDFGDRKRTYYISRAKWESFWHTQGKIQWMHLCRPEMILSSQAAF